MPPIKKLTGLLCIAAFVVAGCVLLFNNNSIDHIEDTNGDDNYALQVLTDENIIKRDVGTRGFSSTTNNITNRTVYS